VPTTVAEMVIRRARSQLLENWCCEFKSHFIYGCLSMFFYVQLSCVHRLEVLMWVNQSKVNVKASHNTYMEAQGGEDV
jgi:hypothetical protein